MAKDELLVSMGFEAFKKYVLPHESESSKERYLSQKHHLFPLCQEEIERVAFEVHIPSELYHFYHLIGYGFFFQADNDYFDRLIDVSNFKAINLREDYYQSDPDLELYQSPTYSDKLIFFELSEGTYLLIDNVAQHGKNAVYYFTHKIAESLEEFLDRFDREGHYFVS